MTYDQWRLESREDEQERLETPARRRALRLQWLEDHADYLADMKRERRLDRHENPPLHTAGYDIY